MNDNLHKGAGKNLFEYARLLRKNSTKGEKIFWEQVRGRRFCDLKFRRQHPIAGFIADFYCHEKSLIIEIDGSIHDSQDQLEYDKGRTSELESLGLRVIRFRNEEVEENIAWVLGDLKKYLIPNPSPK